MTSTKKSIHYTLSTKSLDCDGIYARLKFGGNDMNVNWDEQYAQLEMDEAYDKYLDRCAILGMPPMPFGVWKKYYK